MPTYRLRLQGGCKRRTSISQQVRNRIWLGWLGCFAAALTLYAATASRGAQWQDSGYFILRTVTGELMNPLGLALIHPLHYWLSRMAVRFGFVEPAYAITLISSLAAALAVANMYGCIFSLTANKSAAWLVAASLALANTFWQLATKAEVYSLTAALLTAECWCLILLAKSARSVERLNPTTPEKSTSSKHHWAFLGLFFFNGLSLSNHNFALLTLPVLALAALWALHRGYIPARILAPAIFLWLVGSSPYTVIVIGEGLRSGDWANTIHSALYGKSFKDEVLSASISAQGSLINLGFVLLNFPNLLLPAAFYGMTAVGRPSTDRWLYRMLFLGFAIHALFAFRYPVVDQYCFFIPSYIFLCLFAGVGFARFFAQREDAAISSSRRSFFKKVIMLTWLLVLATPLVYMAAPALARRFDALGYFSRNKPYRDDYAYLFHPWSVLERSAERMSKEALDLAGPSGVIIVEDQMASYAVQYKVHRTGRSGIAVLNELAPREFEEAASAGRPIVLVPRDADRPITLPLSGTWRRQGDLYVLEPG